MKKDLRLLAGNKSFWQIFLAILMLVFFLYFINNEHVEIRDIHRQLSHAKTGFLFTGIATSLIYIFLQGLMYLFSFRAVHQKIGISESIILFLKRNFISVFLPAGGVSSLAFFTKPLEEKGISKTNVYYASFIYAVTGIFTVVIIAIPAIIITLRTDLSALHSVFIYSIVFVLITGLSGWLVYLVVFRGFGTKLIARLSPELSASLENLRASKLSVPNLFAVTGISLVIELVGILQVYIALMAIGAEATFAISLIAYVLMTVFLIISPFLRGLGAIEVSLTLLFTHYGFSTVQATSAMLLFRLFEFWLPLLYGLLIFIVKPGKLLLRIFPMALLFTLGVVNILSALTPAIPERIRLLKDYLPVNVINTSNLLVLAFGIILLANSYFLLRRLKPAWWLALFISLLSLIGHLTKGIDYEEATLAAVVVVSLLASRKEYIFKSVIIVSRHFFYLTLIAGASVIVFNIAGFYFLEKYHFNHDFTISDSFSALLHIWTFSGPEPADISVTPFAKLFLTWVRISGIGLAGILAYGIFKPFFQHTYNDKEQLEKAKDLVHKYGQSPLDYYKTYFDKILFFSEDPDDGFLAYKVHKGIAIVLENPVCPSNKTTDLIKDFTRYCITMDYLCFFYRLPETDLLLYKNLGLKTLPIGQEAILDLDRFTLEGREMKSIRNAVRKVEKSGFTAKIYPPPVPDGKLQQCKQVSDEWLNDLNRKELVFSQGMFVDEEIKKTTILAVENQEGKVAGFLNIIPDYKANEGTYDLIRKAKDAPNGIMDYLLIHMFEYFKNQGHRYANLGMAPLTGSEFDNRSITQAFHLLAKVIRKLNEFKGLKEYKDKFKPEWENRYLAYENDFDLLLLPGALSGILKP